VKYQYLSIYKSITIATATSMQVEQFGSWKNEAVKQSDCLRIQCLQRWWCVNTKRSPMRGESLLLDMLRTERLRLTSESSDTGRWVVMIAR